MKHLWLLFCLGFILNFNILAINNIPVIYQIDIHKEISPTTRLYLSNGIQEAQSIHAKAIIINMNTYGGTVEDADSMRSAILYSPIPVYTYINNNAASAGALIAIASQKIFMVKGANIGAATVVEQTGNAAPDKYQSYMRGMMRTTAESHGKDTIISSHDTIFKWKRDPHIAEAMVDQSIYIPHINDSGKVITFSTEEAIKHGYCDGIVNNVDELIKDQLHYKEYQLVTYKPSVWEDIKGFLMNPVFQGILIMIIVAGIYFELQSPGIGFPAIAACVAAVLYFTPLCIDGVAEYWEIIIFIIGLILIALEIFVIPGFGIAGISGIILTISGLVLALLNNTNFNFESVAMPDLSRSILTVMCGIFVGFALMIYMSSRIGEPGLFRKIALHTNIESSIITHEEKNSLTGKTGIAVTILKPSGKVMIADEIFDAIAEVSYIDEGTPVKVTRQEAAQIYVDIC